MTRPWSATLKSELQGATPLPLVLIDIGTGSSPATVYITNSAESLSVAGTTYSARPVSVSAHTISGSEYPGIDVSLGDGDGYWDTWLLTTTFRKQRLRVLLMDRDQTGSLTHARVDTFRIVQYSRGDREVTLRAEPLTTILSEIMIPRRVLSRNEFPGLPTEVL